LQIGVGGTRARQEHEFARGAVHVKNDPQPNKYCSLHFFCSAISSISRKVHGIYLVRSAKISQENPSIFGTTVVTNCKILTQFLSWFYVFKLHDYIKSCSANVVQHLLEIVYNIMSLAAFTLSNIDFCM
jgi:hypothetical protein